MFFAAHGITRIERVVTDNGSCYRASDYAGAVTAAEARQQRIRPSTPRHNGRVERYNRILADEFLYARAWTSEQQRTHQPGVWKVHYNYHRRQTAIRDRPPPTPAPKHVTNVMASHTTLCSICGPDTRGQCTSRYPRTGMPATWCVDPE